MDQGHTKSLRRQPVKAQRSDTPASGGSPEATTGGWLPPKNWPKQPASRALHEIATWDFGGCEPSPDEAEMVAVAQRSIDAEAKA
jgi:hypothetical protein